MREGKSRSTRQGTHQASSQGSSEPQQYSEHQHASSSRSRSQGQTENDARPARPAKRAAQTTDVPTDQSARTSGPRLAQLRNNNERRSLSSATLDISESSPTEASSSQHTNPNRNVNGRDTEQSSASGTSNAQATMTSSSFLNTLPATFATPEDMDDLLELLDNFQQVRRDVTCVACQGTGKRDETVVSSCCLAFSCKTCITQFLMNNSKRCMNCNMNWGPFRLSQVLVSPPCAQYASLSTDMRDNIRAHWNEAVQFVRNAQ